MITGRIGLHSVLLPLSIDNWFSKNPGFWIETLLKLTISFVIIYFTALFWSLRTFKAQKTTRGERSVKQCRMRMRGELILEGLLIYQTANLVLRVLTLLAGSRWLRDATCDAARFGSFLHPTDSPRQPRCFSRFHGSHHKACSDPSKAIVISLSSSLVSS